MTPQTGDIVRVRARQYLVEGTAAPINPTDSTLVRLSCLEDDAQGEPLEVLWEREIDAPSEGGELAARGQPWLRLAPLVLGLSAHAALELRDCNGRAAVSGAVPRGH